MEQNLGSDIILFGSDMILLGSRFHDISVFVVSILINFGVKKQVPQVSFKIGSDMELFGSDMI